MVQDSRDSRIQGFKIQDSRDSRFKRFEDSRFKDSSIQDSRVGGERKIIRIGFLRRG